MSARLPKPSSTAVAPAIDLAVFRRMVDLSTEGFYVLDRHGRFLYCNAQAHAQMGGYSMEEILRLTVSAIAPGMTPERFAAQVAALEIGPLPRLEVETVRKDGVTFPAEVSMARLVHRGEVYLFGVARDVSERKRAEAGRKRFAAELLHTIERERQRVARELHDDVGQAVATIGVLLDTLELGPAVVPDAARASFTSTRDTIRQITESLARIVREYHPADLLGLGLEDTVRAHARQFGERHKLTMRLATVRVDDRLTPEQELHVYRVVQEALANIARHACATTVTITLARVVDDVPAGDQLIVTIRDDGVGFSPAEPVTGIGLATMRERATLLHGALAIDSASDRGTTVQLAVPLATRPAYPDAARQAMPAAAVAHRPPETDQPAALPEMLDLDLFREMADMASESLQLLDADGRFVYVNDQTCTRFGYGRDELLGMSVTDLNPDFTREAWRAWTAATRGPVPPFEAKNTCKDGSIVPIEVCAAPIDVHGVTHYFAVIRDITERKEAEAAERGFTRRLLHTLEAERRRVARELHDEVGQAIAAVGVLLHAIENAGSPRAKLHPELAATHATIRQITESVARIVRDYHPVELLALGLEETLRTHARQFTQRHGLALRLSTTAVDGLFSDEHALHVYRILQEALANVARHAHARRVTVQLVRQGTRVTATVRDDGSGFHPRDGRGRGFGLVTMRERAALIGGTLAIRSTPQRGTEVKLAVTGDAVPVEIAPCSVA